MGCKPDQKIVLEVDVKVKLTDNGEIILDFEKEVVDVKVNDNTPLEKPVVDAIGLTILSTRGSRCVYFRTPWGWKCICR